VTLRRFEDQRETLLPPVRRGQGANCRPTGPRRQIPLAPKAQARNRRAEIFPPAPRMRGPYPTGANMQVNETPDEGLKRAMNHPRDSTELEAQGQRKARPKRRPEVEMKGFRKR